MEAKTFELNFFIFALSDLGSLKILIKSPSIIISTVIRSLRTSRSEQKDRKIVLPRFRRRRELRACSAALPHQG